MKARCPILATVAGALGLMVLVLASPPASAQMLRCANHVLSRQDDERLDRAANAKAPAGVVFQRRDKPCNNPDFARAWLSSPHRTLSDGVRSWWTILCHRGTSLWTCDEPDYRRELDVEASVDGIVRKIELALDADASLELTRRFAPDAVQLIYGAVPAPPPPCDSNADLDWWEKSKASMRLPAAPEIIQMQVAAEPNGIRFGFDLTISFRPVAKESGSYAPCWQMWIIVT